MLDAFYFVIKDYMKGSIEGYGVKMGQIRTLLKAWWKDESIDARPVAVQKDLADALLSKPIFEEKMAGTLLLAEHIGFSGPPASCVSMDDLPRFRLHFTKGRLADWNSVDWFCIKVLEKIVRRDGEPAARVIASWKDEPSSLWCRRAACVSFVYLAKHGDASPPNWDGFTDMLEDVADTIIHRDERFMQTAAGWLLREMGVADAKRVEEFCRAHAEHFSAEGMRYATEKMPAAKAKTLMNLRNKAVDGKTGRSKVSGTTRAKATKRATQPASAESAGGAGGPQSARAKRARRSKD